jgi:GT2 family glycosyltransferase
MSKENFSNPFFSIVMPNWNGAEFVARGISSMLLSARAAGKPFEMIIVDDASTDTAPRIIAGTFQDVRLLINERNRGFSASVNRGVNAAKAPIIILANNDLVVREDFVPRLLEHFEHDAEGQIFGVSARTVNWTDGAPNHLNMSAHFSRGLIELDYEDSPESAPTLFIQGGACALRRDIFLTLGGFSAIYKPAYWEDYDISYRAAKMGYKLIYEPQALAYHLGRGSLSKVLGKEGVNSLTSRNYFLFTWLNLTDRSLLTRHFFSLPYHLFREIISGDEMRLTKGFFKAAPKLPQVMKARRKRTYATLVPDKILLRRQPLNESASSH